MSLCKVSPVGAVQKKSIKRDRYICKLVNKWRISVCLEHWNMTVFWKYYLAYTVGCIEDHVSWIVVREVKECKGAKKKSGFVNFQHIVIEFIGWLSRLSDLLRGMLGKNTHVQKLFRGYWKFYSTWASRASNDACSLIWCGQRDFGLLYITEKLIRGIFPSYNKGLFNDLWVHHTIQRIGFLHNWERTSRLSNNRQRRILSAMFLSARLVCLKFWLVDCKFITVDLFERD